MKDKLIAKFHRREARIAVIGLGYVGLPLAVNFAQAGYEVIGIDLDRRKVAAINSGESYIEDVPSEAIAVLVNETSLVLADGQAVIAGDHTNSPASQPVGGAPRLIATSDYALLASLPAGLVLNSPNEGPAILDFTHHFALSGNYHRNGDAILKSMRFFGGTEDEARRIADEVKPQYVAYCQRDPALEQLKPESGEMKQRILRGDYPSWLEPLSGPDDRLIVMRFRG